jgi:DNA replication protein DnaC
MAPLPHTQEMTFLNFDHFDNRSERDRQWRERAYQVAMDFGREPANWLALMGGRERDRTHLLAAICNAQREAGESPLLVRVNDLLDYLRHAMKGEGDEDYYVRKRALRAHPLLLLDELEIGTGSDYARRELYDLLYWRQMAHLPTVISSPNEVNQLLSDAGWMRLARLLRVPNFVTEVPAGENPPEEEPKRSKAPPSFKSARAGTRSTRKAG